MIIKMKRMLCVSPSSSLHIPPHPPPLYPELGCELVLIHYSPLLPEPFVMHIVNAHTVGDVMSQIRIGLDRKSVV